MARVVVSEVFRTGGAVDAVVEVLNGIIRQGDKMSLEGNVGRIVAIEKDHRRIPSAQENDVVSIRLGGVTTDDIMAGESYNTA